MGAALRAGVKGLQTGPQFLTLGFQRWVPDIQRPDIPVIPAEIADAPVGKGFSGEKLRQGRRGGIVPEDVPGDELDEHTVKGLDALQEPGQFRRCVKTKPITQGPGVGFCIGREPLAQITVDQFQFLIPQIKQGRAFPMGRVQPLIKTTDTPHHDAMERCVLFFQLDQDGMQIVHGPSGGLTAA